MKMFMDGGTLRRLVPRARFARAIAAVALASVFTAACDVHGVSEPGSLSSLSISPNTQTLAINGTQQFSAIAMDAAGASVSITPTWSIVAGGGTISSSGIFTAGGTPGTYTSTVKATSGSFSSTATIVVTVGPLASITILPPSATLVSGAAMQFTAVGKDAGGNVVAMNPTWSVVAGGGTVSATTGLFTAGNSTGTYLNTVRVSVGSLSAFATVTVTNGALASITVTPTPVTVQTLGTQQFTAVGRDAVGNVLTITPVWSVVNGGGSIDPNTGLFTADVTPGTFNNTVQASSNGVSGFATVSVTTNAPALDSIIVTPNPVSVLANGTQQFTASGRDADGNVFPVTPIWSVENGGGTIDANGLFKAGAVTGTFSNTVKATSGTKSGTATVSVTTTTPAALVNLGAAALNGIMAGTAVTCVIGGTIHANVSVSPGSTITGFPPCVITGVRHLADATALQGQTDLTAAYNTLAGMPCPPANAIVANLGGTTKPAGVYCSASTISVTGTLTLNGGGDPNATFVFQAGSDLITAGNIVLINGAQAKNVYWKVGTSATLGTASQWQGNILALTSITLVDNANLFGRALARNGAVTLGTNNVITLP